MAWTDRIALRVSAANERATITILAWSFLALLCVSLVLVSQNVQPAFHIKFDGDTVKKSVVLKLPVTIDVDREKKTYSIEYGKVSPIKFKDGTKVTLQFGEAQSGKYQTAK